MLRKLLKYDLASVGRYWWILVPSSLGVSCIGGLAFRYLIYAAEHDDQSNVLLTLFAMLALIVCFIALAGSLVATPILVYIRFYKHLFTDEGYLTFTLPVSRRSLLLSKTLNAIIWTVGQMLLWFTCFGILLTIAGTGSSVFSSEMSEMLHEFRWLMSMIGYSLNEAIGTLGETIGLHWLIIWLIEGVLIFICACIYSVCSFQFSITVGAVIAKKAKVFVGIGIQYGLSSVLSFVTQMATLIIVPALFEGLAQLAPDPTNAEIGWIITLLLAIVLMMALALVAVLYYTTLGLLERKLNLS